MGLGPIEGSHRTGPHARSFGPPTEARDPRTVEAICRFRESVWRATGELAEDAFLDGRWRDDFDDVSRHWLVREGRRIVAAARLSVHARLDDVPEADEYLACGLRIEGLVAAPARVVVSPTARGCGLASRLLDVQDMAAIEAGAGHAVRQASPEMLRLLSRRGWHDLGPARHDPRFPKLTFRIMLRRYDAADPTQRGS